MSAPSGGEPPQHTAGSPHAGPEQRRAEPFTVDEQGVAWYRVHRVTPVLGAWKAAAAVLAIGLYQGRELIDDLHLGASRLILIGLGALLLGAVIGLVAGAIGWRFRSYGIGPDTIFLHQGVLFKSQRHVRLDRLQAVDVTQPLVARIFGFASLRIESAGGSDSNLTIAYLTESEAHRLRNEILARAAGVKAGRRATEAAPSTPPAASPSAAGMAGAAGVAGAAGPAATGQQPAEAPARESDAGEPAAEAPAAKVLELPGGRLVASLALSASVVVILLLIIAAVVAAVITGAYGAIGSSIVPLLGAAAYLWSRFAGEFGFSLYTSADGLRIRQGLLETKHSTIPPGRIQAVELSQPLLWRRAGWWRMKVNVAGRSGTSDGGEGGVLFPAATGQEVGQILYLVLPDLGDADPLGLIRAGSVGTGSQGGFITSPRRARWLDPLTWRRNGFRVTGTAVLLRTGRIWRHLAFVPHARTQSLSLSQGPLERRMRLVAFNLHSTPGEISPRVRHLDEVTGRELLLQQSERAREARAAAGPEQWMRQNQRS